MTLPTDNFQISANGITLRIICRFSANRNRDCIFNVVIIRRNYNFLTLNSLFCSGLAPVVQRMLHVVQRMLHLVQRMLHLH